MFFLNPMKLKPNKKKAVKQREEEVVEVVSEVGGLIDKYNAVFTDLRRSVIGRNDEIAALRLCVVCRQHLLLEGLHGTAKSMLASAFATRVNGAQFFKKLLMKTTQADELFGPMSAKKYRDEEIWHHNTEGMLPTADFAYLDEVYRGSDAILPTMLNILNEREFINGRTVTKCPLVTAIGTCNFLPDNTELDAFHDRWLVHLKVNPLDTPNNRIKALNRYLANEVAKDQPEHTIELNEILELSQYLNQVSLPDQVLELYEELIRRFRANCGNVYISDRRFCHAIQLARAAVVLDNKLGEDFPPEYLHFCMPAFMINEKATAQAFSDAFAAVIGDFQLREKELKNIQSIEDGLNTLRSKFDPSLPREKLVKMHSSIKDILEAIANMEQSEQPTTEIGKKKLEECVHGYNTLLNSCTQALE